MNCLVLPYSDILVFAVPNLEGLGYSKETITVEYKWEPPRCRGTCVLVDDAGKPLKKIDYLDDHDSEDAVEPVDNDMENFLASKPSRVGYGTNSFLEQYRETYGNAKYDYDPYDDDLYEDPRPIPTHGEFRLDIQRNLAHLGAYDMLQELKAMFSKQAEQELLQTVREFHTCKQEEGQSVSSHVLKMKGYIDNLERLGQPVGQNLAVSLILVSLNKDFTSFVQNFNMHGMGKTVNELHAMLKLHEESLPKKDANPALHAIRAGRELSRVSSPRLMKRRKLSRVLALQGLRGSRKLKQGFESGVISVSRLFDDGFVNRFDDNKLFQFQSSMYAITNKRAKINLDSSLLWHCRLGHISKKRIEKLQHDGLLNSIDIESLGKCVSCLSGKMARKPYSHQVERAKDLLGLIHTDVCGPFRIVSRQGASYFVTFTDDFSRYGYVYLLKHKHEVFETFKVFQKEVENQLGKTIKSLRSDRGGEYMSQEFLDHLKEHGIIAHRTPPYTPQNNGVSERRNRTLLDMVRSMMSQTTLPKSFWDYALETAARILNMVPSKKVDKTPYEIWHGQAPKLSYLRVWGCEAFVKHDTLTKPDKLDPRSFKCIFIGYPKETMGYSFYSPSENKVFVARNAEFFESKLLDLKASGSVEDLELFQEEDTNPSVDTSLNHEEDDQEIDEPQRDLGEPANYKAALLDPESKKWLDAMNVQMQSMKENDVWVLVKLPPNARTVGSKWLFKKKTDMDGAVYIFKARLVAKGFTQTYRVDYEETFSLVADIRAIRILIAIATYYDYEIWQMDVKTAFLNGHLFEEVYMEQPKRIYRIGQELIVSNQSTYIEKNLKRFYVENPSVERSQCQKAKLRSIMYVVRCTRPDVAFAQNMTSRFQQNPGEEHWTAVKNILKYLRNTKDMFLVYGGNMKRQLRVSCYTDAGYLTDADNLKSQTGYVFVLNGGVVDWKSTKQSIFATSSTDAEYIAAFDASKEAVWIRKFIFGLGIVPTIEEPINPRPIPTHGEFRLDIQRNLAHLGAYDMLQELKAMFSKQAEQELLQTVREFHTCKQEEGQSVSSHVLKMKGYIDNLERLGQPVGQNLAVSLILVSLNKDFTSFVQNFNMHGMGKTVNELHAMLKLHEESLPKKDANPALHAIRAGRVQKNQKNKPHKASRGGKGKGKNKMGYAQNNVPFDPKPKVSFTTKRITSKDDLPPMCQTTLPNSFWDYALESAARILNMVPTKKVDKTPYEIWHGQAPKLSYLRVWILSSFKSKLLDLKASGSVEDLELFQEEDTNPSVDTSLNHEEDDQEIDEPQSDINPSFVGPQACVPTDRLFFTSITEE
ncbi:retrotransposon protein, putative, ty1-copia subclass [Tanacetum coccineum]